MRTTTEELTRIRKETERLAALYQSHPMAEHAGKVVFRPRDGGVFSVWKMTPDNEMSIGAITTENRFAATCAVFGAMGMRNIVNHRSGTVVAGRVFRGERFVQYSKAVAWRVPTLDYSAIDALSWQSRYNEAMGRDRMHLCGLSITPQPMERQALVELGYGETATDKELESLQDEMAHSSRLHFFTEADNLSRKYYRIALGFFEGHGSPDMSDEIKVLFADYTLGSISREQAFYNLIELLPPVHTLSVVRS
jgi:hypothetical protein